MIIERATSEHLLQMQDRMRTEDYQEVFDSTGEDPYRILSHCVERSTEAWTWMHDGQAGAMFGVAQPSLASSWGMPWMLTTDSFGKMPISVARKCRLVVAGWKRSYNRLENYVDSRYEVCIKWLKWLGFTIENAEPFGKHQIPFHRFWMMGE